MVELRFHIKDFQGNQKVEPIHIKREKGQKYQRFQNVKPEDIDGIKEEGTEPDEHQFLTDAENDARDGLIKSVVENVAKLPELVFGDGRKKEQDGDFEGAAEYYILYLNSTAPAETPERNHAETFLLNRFNIDWKMLNLS